MSRCPTPYGGLVRWENHREKWWFFCSVLRLTARMVVQWCFHHKFQKSNCPMTAGFSYTGIICVYISFISTSTSLKNGSLSLSILHCPRELKVSAVSPSIYHAWDARIKVILNHPEFNYHISYHWPSQEPKFEVPTTYKAYVRAM